jgi:hypothetical protein
VKGTFSDPHSCRLLSEAEPIVHHEARRKKAPINDIGGMTVADPRAFISFDFDNNENSRMLFVGQAKNSKTPFSIEDWSSKNALPQSQWEALITSKVGRCNMLIVLVGKSMGSAIGVAKEIAMAKEKDVPVFGVYVDGATTSSTLPTGLPRNRTIPWKWDEIASAITQMMGEGKNSK